ncbi:SPFH/Band 7/PHB domain protein [Candidatus Microgenomates bacterium]|nr:SPFH/Band 7/PHB domain protein [Candidatus Microgenomates bacterium]
MEIVLLVIILIIALLALATGARVINQYEKGVVMRLGKYKSTVDSGIVFIIPFIESIISVDMREKVIAVEPQQVITKDNVTVMVDAVIYVKVIDPVKAEFEVQDFGLAATTLAQTNLRNLIGDKTLDETLVARDLINANLRDVLDEATHNWGVKVTRVEVQRIDPPEDITTAMSRQMKAEREKRASILQSEGLKQSQILEAQGEAEAKITRAKGEAESIRLVSEAAEKYFTKNALALKQLEVSKEVLSNATKWVLPSDSQLINVLGNDNSTFVPINKK